MIRFLGKTEDGDERVSVVDWSRRKRNERGLCSRSSKADELEFTFRTIEPGEPYQWYLDKIMNAYWWETGKNKRRYQDE